MIPKNTASDIKLLAFRLSQAPAESQRPALRGLEPGQSYQFTNPYTDEQVTYQGRKLVEAGLPFTLEANGSRLLRYRPK